MVDEGYIFALVIPILLLGVLAIFIRPYIGLLCIILLQIPMASSVAGFTAPEVIFVTLTIFTLYSWFVKKILLSEKGIAFNRTSRFVILFLISVMVSILISIGNGYDTIKVFKEAAPFLLVSLSFVVAHEVNTERRIWWMTVFILLASTVIITHCLIITLSNGYFLTNPYVGESGTPFNSSLYLVATPISISALLLSSGKYEKSALYVIVLLHVWRSVVGFRRQPIIILLVMLIVVPYIVNKIRRTGLATLLSIGRVSGVGLVIIAAAGVYMVDVAPQDFSGRVLTTQGPSRFSTESVMRGLSKRFAQYIAAFNYFMDSPIFGNGIVFDHEINVSSFFGNINTLTESDARIHSLYFYLLMKTGFLGLVTALFILLQSTRDLVQTRIATARLRETHRWAAGGAGVLIVVLMLGVLSVKSYSLEVWMTIGLVVGISLQIHSRTIRAS